MCDVCNWDAQFHPQNYVKKKKVAWKILRLISAYRFHAQILRHKKCPHVLKWKFKQSHSSSVCLFVRCFCFCFLCFSLAKWLHLNLAPKIVLFMFFFLCFCRRSHHHHHHRGENRVIQRSIVCKHVRCGLYHIWAGIKKKKRWKKNLAQQQQLSKNLKFYNGVIYFTLNFGRRNLD